MSSQSIDTTLKSIFGYNSFRPHQEDIVSTILANQDCLSVLPTGSGKSLCFQLPVHLMEGTAIVVSPLIALMQDQVTYLKQLGIKATVLNSSLSGYERDHITQNMNDYKLIYVAPERLASETFMPHLKTCNIAYFVIDEAHCISQWGHSFRPEYRQMSMLKELFPDKAVAAFTATATQTVAKDITQALGMTRPKVIISSFDRPNLTLGIQEKAQAKTQLLQFLEQRPHESGIIYAGTRKLAEKTCELLKTQGYRAGVYHAGLSDQARSQMQAKFMRDDVPIMVATVAFGMGVHKPDIRFVFHMNMPATTEQYYQEIGRAGRDGLPATCKMLYSHQDLVVKKRLLEELEDVVIKAQLRKKADQLFALCSSVQCRRVEILGYFDEITQDKKCNNCDNCLDEVEQFDGTIIAQKILSCVHRLQNRFGINYVIEVLTGSKNQKIMDRRHDQISTYNLMPEYSKQELRYYIFLLINMGTLIVSEGDYPLLQLTNTSRDILSNRQKVMFRKKIFKTRAEKKPKEIIGFDYDQDLYQQLAQWRRSKAQALSVPAYVVFHDKTLMAFAHYKPKSVEELLEINGVGSRKVEQHGQEILKLIQER